MGGMFGGSVYRAPFLFLILGLPVLFIFALWMAFKKPIDKIPINENQRVMLFYMCLVIAYVALVGNALEIPENNRFRFLTDAFYVTIFGLVVQFYILPYFKHNHPPSV
jgi:FtsH-binding integral membrane protein